MKYPVSEINLNAKLEMYRWCIKHQANLGQDFREFMFDIAEDEAFQKWMQIQVHNSKMRSDFQRSGDDDDEILADYEEVL